MTAGSWVERGLQRWWVRWPLRARRVSSTAAQAAFDGHWLTCYPRLAVIAPPAALLLGLVVGWKQPLYRDLFSESIVLLGLILAVGTLSAGLALLFTIGFVIGDFVLLRESWAFCCDGWASGLFSERLVAHILRERVPLFIIYALLVLGAVLVPLAVKGILVRLRLRPGTAREYQLAVGFVGHVLATVALVWLWAQTVPVLIRPFFVWPMGSSPSVEAMEVLQERLVIVLAVVALASAARMTLQIRAASRPEVGLRMDLVELQLGEAEPVVPLWGRLPRVARLLVVSASGAVLLGGLYEDWRDGVAVGAALLLVTAIRYRLLPLPLGPWRRLMFRIPLAARVGVGAGIAYVVARRVIEAGYAAGPSFRPLTFSVVGALVLFYLLNPVVEEAPPAVAADEPAVAEAPT